MIKIRPRGILFLISVVFGLSFEPSDACCDVDYCIFERCKFEIQEDLGKDPNPRARVTYILMHTSEELLQTMHGKQYFREIRENIRTNTDMNSFAFCEAKHPTNDLLFKNPNTTKSANCFWKLERFEIQTRTYDSERSLLNAYNSMTIYTNGVDDDVKDYLRFIGGKVTILKKLLSEDTFCKIKHCEKDIFDEFGFSNAVAVVGRWIKNTFLYKKLDKIKKRVGKLFLRHINENIIPGKSMKGPKDFCFLKYTDEKNEAAWKWEYEKQEESTVPDQGKGPNSTTALRPRIRVKLTIVERNDYIEACQKTLKGQGFLDERKEDIVITILNNRHINQYDNQDINDYIFYVADNFTSTIQHPTPFCTRLVKN